MRSLREVQRGMVDMASIRVYSKYVVFAFDAMT